METKQKIENGLVFQKNGTFLPSSLYVCGGRILSEEDYMRKQVPETVTDASGCYVIPGLVDIHLHGGMGSDCCDGTRQALRTLAQYELRCGVTAITAATMTMPEDVLLRACEAANGFFCENGADFLGLYLEGPFISPARKGAQDEAFIRAPDIRFLSRLQVAAGGCIRTVVVAPETDGAIPFIREAGRDMAVSIGHTDADYGTAKAAIANGASRLTHMFNAMPPLSHRAPGPIGAAAEEGHCMAELICDGVHVHPSAVRAAFSLFGKERVIFISDSMRAAGLGNGAYDLGGQEVRVNGNVATLKDGTLAGSVTNLMDCVRTAVLEMGIPLGDAVRCASVNPARALGLSADYGTLSPEARANIVALGENLDIRFIWHRGEPANF